MSQQPDQDPGPGPELDHPGPELDHPGPAWERYRAALEDLHRARSAVSDGVRAAQRERASRRGAIDHLAAALAAQRDRLYALALELRAPLDATGVSPLPDAPPLPWPAAEEDARVRLASADAAIAHAHQVGGLPQLFPQWSSQFARAAVVYLVVVIPQVFLVTGLSLAGVHGSTAALAWFVLIGPLVAAVAGAWAVGRVSAPRRPLPPQVPPARTQGPRRYPWLGVVLAWAAWFVPGWLLDQIR